tara:strand:- start:79 stop:660 length:582 start_codon:yes stop_codon:yes gene_type:complete
MRLFGRFYDKALSWSRHPHAPRYLFGLSFTEAFFFPIPPDVMLAPMVLAQRNKAWRFAALTSFSSVLGGLFGYLLGMFLYVQVGDALIKFYNAEDAYSHVQEWFSVYGVWVILIASFTPIPYKLFTITAGAVSMALLPFMILSLIGRSARFFLLAALIYFAGPKLEPLISRFIELLGWIFVIGAILVYFFIIR